MPLSWDNSRIWLSQTRQQATSVYGSQDRNKTTRRTVRAEDSVLGSAENQKHAVRGNTRSFTFVEGGSRAKKRRVTRTTGEPGTRESHDSGSTIVEISALDLATSADCITVADGQSCANVVTLDSCESGTRSTQEQLPARDLSHAAEDSQSLDNLVQDDATISAQLTKPSVSTHDSAVVSDLSLDLLHDMSSTISGEAWDMFSEHFDAMLADPSNLQFSDLVDFAPTVMQNLSPDGAMNLITEAVGPQHAWLLEKCSL